MGLEPPNAKLRAQLELVQSHLVTFMVAPRYGLLTDCLVQPYWGFQRWSGL